MIKASIKTAKWEVVEVLRASFNLFYNVPARRALCKEVLGFFLFLIFSLRMSFRIIKGTKGKQSPSN